MRYKCKPIFGYITLFDALKPCNDTLNQVCDQDAQQEYTNVVDNDEIDFICLHGSESSLNNSFNFKSIVLFPTAFRNDSKGIQFWHRVSPNSNLWIRIFTNSTTKRWKFGAGSVKGIAN